MEEAKLLSDDVVHNVEVKPKVESNNTTEIVRLTPTGKISHAKTRVYTQRYRKEWEHMTDFKDWLTSVPYQATRAFCKFCQRNLHAHRLSLLKHMCTLKHQRAAIQYNKRPTVNNQQMEDTSNDMNYVVERLEAEEDDEDTNYDETTYVQEEGEEISIESEVQEEIVEETECEVSSPVSKKIRLQKDENQDTLEEEMVHEDADYLTETDEPIELEMEDESEHDNNEEEAKSYQLIKYENLQNSKNQFAIQKEISSKNNKHILNDELQKSLNSNGEDIKPAISVSDSKNVTLSTGNSKKVYFFSTGGKSYTLVKSKLPQLVLNQLNDKNFSVFAKSDKNELNNCKDVIREINTTSASTSQDPTNKKVLVANTPSLVSSKSVLLKRPIVSTHVLETSKGVPVCGLQVSLYKLQDGRWTFIHESITSANGNCSNFLNTSKNNLSTGRYKLHYDVEKYYAMKKVATIYPFIEIVFDIKDPNTSYHIPLLLSPFSYSTYKDTHR